MGDTAERLSWALEIAKRGFYIFPLAPGTKGGTGNYYGDSWKANLSRDPDVIRSWFAEYKDMNYGVCPGVGGAIIDLDESEGKHGIAVYAALEADQPVDQHIQGMTFEVQSARGGRHLYVTVDEPVSNSHGFGFGVDVRGEGGYVVGPGCVWRDENGKLRTYKVIVDQPFAVAPKWQTERMRDNELNQRIAEQIVDLDLPSSISQAKSYIRNRAPAIEGCSGDHHTFVTACFLRRDFALSEDVALDMLADYQYVLPTDPKGMPPRSWNERCVPPWEKYGQHGTLEDKVRNAGRYAQHHIGEKSGATLLLDGLDLTEALEAAKVRDEVAAAQRSALQRHFLRGKDILTKLKPPTFLIPCWMLDTGIHAVIGKRGIGKSSLMIDLALRMAHDMDWHETVTRTGVNVMYLCGEDERGAGSQIRAWCVKHNVAEPDPKRFVFADTVPDLGDEEAVAMWADAMRSELGPGKTVTFFDTWQRGIATLKQNEDQDMQRAVRAVEALSAATGGPVIAMFHPPKSDEHTIAGSAVQMNTNVAEWYITEEPRGLKLHVGRIKGEGKNVYTIFQLEEVDTGLRDEFFGFPIKHVVPKRVAGVTIDRNGDKRTDEDLSAIRKAICEVLKDMDARRLDETPEFKSCYTTKQAAMLMVGGAQAGMSRPSLLEREDDWAAEQVAKLREAGLNFPMHPDNMQSMIERVLGAGDRPGGYEFEGGVRLTLVRHGNGLKIAFDSAGIGAT